MTKFLVGHEQDSLKSMHKASDMVHVRDTLSCHNDHLCGTIFKSHRALQSYTKVLLKSMHKV